MISFFSLWLLLAATPLLAKSIGQAEIISHQHDVLDMSSLMEKSRSLSPDRFLQISRKSCRGPENQYGTCMFNFECQQQHGQVVGACLDGFLFGACCHLTTDQSIGAANPSTTQVISVANENSSVSPNWNSSSHLAEDADADSSQIEEASTEQEVSSWRVPTVDDVSESSSDLYEDSSDSTDDIPPPVVSSSNQMDVAPHLPLVLMFMNKTSEASILPAFQPALESAWEKEEVTTPRVVTNDSITSKLNLVVSNVAENQVNGPSVTPTPNNDNQISPATKNQIVVLDKEDSALQSQLAVLFDATVHADKTSSTTVQPTSSSTTSRIPTRKAQGPKRPRPSKPSVATTSASTSTASTIISTKLAEDENRVTTSGPLTSSTVAESLADQQANVLQFLVSNPPAWVLDEIINGSTLTTWFPLPIPDQLPGTLMTNQSGETTTTPATFNSDTITSKPVKRKPTKTRPSGPNRNSITTPSTIQIPSSEENDIPTTVISTTSTTTEPTTTTTTTEAVTEPPSTKRPRPIFDYSKDCGVRPMVPEARIVGGRRADYGQWPWQVLIRESTWFGIFSKNKCGGVLISDRHVLTAAHCQPGFLGSLLVVMGEFDLTGHSEPNTPVEKNVKRVVVHRDYVERTFENDLAILELESPVEFKPYIVPICLPSTSEGDFTGKKAEVTGWGKLSHNGPTPGVLYEVDVPIMSNPECHDMFKKAGHEKRILDSFVCAGYAEGKKDSCEGDSGGPLMVEREDGRWSLVGTVSHGIRCAYPNMPGVYMRMTYYRPWIERVTGIGGTNLG